MMDSEKKEKLAARGWVSTTVQEFLGLAPEEAAYIDLKIHLGNELKRLRTANRFTQTSLAKLMGSSQSRVAKMEAGDPSVSMDLLFRAFLYLGVKPRQLAPIIDSFEPANYTGPTSADLLNGDEDEAEKKYRAWQKAVKKASAQRGSKPIDA